MVRWCLVNFQCQGVLLMWITIGHGHTAFVVGASGGRLDSFNVIYNFFVLSHSFIKTVRYRLILRLKGQLSPKQQTKSIF